MTEIIEFTASPASRAARIEIAGQEPIVSVLMKSYNHAPYIRRAIDSILEQSFQDFEIVVTDDGSTDGTADVVRAYRDPRIRLEALAVNRGISLVMNATISRARGKYLAILNSDDWALPGRLARQVAFLDAHPEVAVVFGLPLLVDETGQPMPEAPVFALPFRFPDFSRRYWLRQFFFVGNCVCAPAAMVRRDAYRAVGPYDPRLTNLQDLDMWVRMVLAGQNMHVLLEPMTAFRIRAGQANMSAERPDTRLRTAFETTKILRHFASIDASLFHEVFDGGIAPVDMSHPSPARWVAEIALGDPRPAYQAFALEMLYETARDDADFTRLRVAAGERDVFGILREEGAAGRGAAG